jgi:hypothetical protein
MTGRPDTFRSVLRITAGQVRDHYRIPVILGRRGPQYLSAVVAIELSIRGTPPPSSSRPTRSWRATTSTRCLRPAGSELLPAQEDGPGGTVSHDGINSGGSYPPGEIPVGIDGPDHCPDLLALVSRQYLGACHGRALVGPGAIGARRPAWLPASWHSGALCGPRRCGHRSRCVQCQSGGHPCHSRSRPGKGARHEAIPLTGELFPGQRSASPAP